MAEVFVQQGQDPSSTAGVARPRHRATDLYIANEQISVGMPVMLDSTDSTASAVLIATKAGGLMGKVVGVYTGNGGTGTLATETGLQGRHCITGDYVEITRKGVVRARVSPVTSSAFDNAANQRLTISATAGRYSESTNTTTVDNSGYAAPAILWNSTASVMTASATAYIVDVRICYA